MSDSLASVEDRLASLRHLARGAPLVRELLGIALPDADLARVDEAAVRAETARGGDTFHGLALPALLPHVDAATPAAESMAHFRAFFPAAAAEPLAAAYPPALAAFDLDDQELTRTVGEAMDVRELSVDDVLHPSGCVFLKINHIHWEQVCCRALASVGRRYLRRLDPGELVRVKASGSDDLVLHVLRLVEHDLRAQGAGPGVFDGPGLSFGISFNNGDGRLADDLRPPVLPVMRGAMAGCLGFVQGLLPAPHHRFSDGAFPKMLVWKGEMDAFFERACAQVDAIAFIGPDHLRAIGVRGWSGPTERIVVPPTMISELWPVVLPIVTSRLDELFARHRRVLVLVQAGVQSVALAMAAHRLRRRHAGCVVHFVDMGQALDVAMYPGSGPSTSPWLRQPELQPTLQRLGRFPLFMVPGAGDGG